MNPSKNHVIITKIPFATTERGLFAVPTLWGWDLEAYASVFKKIMVVAPQLPYDRAKFPFVLGKDPNISFCSVPGFTNLRSFVRNLPKIARVLCVQMTNWDVLHCTGAMGTPLGILAHIVGILKRKKRIFVIDADILSDIEIRIKMEKTVMKIFLFLIKGFCLSLLKFCISTSHLTFVVGRGLYERYPNRKVVEIFASWVKRKDIISMTRFKNKLKNISDKKEIRLILASSLTPKKGVIYAIKAIKILQQRSIPVVLDVYGNGPMKNELEKSVQTLGLSGCVFFRGTVPYGEPFYRILREKDIILVPNLSEEQPRILFDALANGLVIVASRTRSINAVISDCRRLLVPLGNSNEIAFAVETLYKNRKNWEQIIIRGLKYAQNHTIESMHQRIAQVINETFR